MYHNQIRSPSTAIKTDIWRDLYLFFNNNFQEGGAHTVTFWILKNGNLKIILGFL